MAITIVGTAGTGTDAAVHNGANKTITLPGGTATGDYLLLFGGHSNRSGFTPGPVTATGWTTIVTHTAASPYAYFGWKLMGATPDTSIDCLGTGNAADACAYGVFVLRGIDINTFTYQTSGPTTSANPDGPSISGVNTANDLVITSVVAAVYDASIGAPTGYTLGPHAAGNDSGEDMTAAAGYKLASGLSEPENPGAFVAFASSAHYLVTFLFKPTGQIPIFVHHYRQQGIA